MDKKWWWWIVKNKNIEILYVYVCFMYCIYIYSIEHRTQRVCARPWCSTPQVQPQRSRVCVCMHYPARVYKVIGVRRYHWGVLRLQRRQGGWFVSLSGPPRGLEAFVLVIYDFLTCFWLFVISVFSAFAVNVFHLIFGSTCLVCNIFPLYLF